MSDNLRAGWQPMDAGVSSRVGQQDGWIEGQIEPTIATKPHLLELGTVSRQQGDAVACCPCPMPALFYRQRGIVVSDSARTADETHAAASAICGTSSAPMPASQP
jgi:hypothetical protein